MRQERSFRRLIVGEAGERFREDERSGRNLLWRGVFVRPVAVPVAARNEDHRRRRDARDEERVVIGAADHRTMRDAASLADFAHSLNDLWAAMCGGIGVELFGLNPHPAASGDFGASLQNAAEYRIAARPIGVA